MNIQKRRQGGKHSEESSVTLTHPEKVLYPKDEITKEDLAEYYQQVASVMLPHAANRPLSFVRCPSGIESSCFFQKHPGHSIPDLKTKKIKERSSTEEYGIITTESDLLGLVQANVLEIHSWQCQANSLERPDQIVLDLDPDAALGWAEVRAAAELLRDFLKELKLKSFPKLTGGKGVHVVIPISPVHTWEHTKRFAKQIADTLVREDPKRFLAVASKSKGRGKIFVDYLRNDRGATAIVSYSTRARPGAPVAMPITWDELKDSSLRLPFTIKTAPKRVKAFRKDPWGDFAKLKKNFPRFELSAQPYMVLHG